MLAREDITRAAHIRGQLINFIKTAIDQRPAIFSLAEIGDNEIVSFRLAELGVLEVDSAHPKALAFEMLYKVRADKTDRPPHKQELFSFRLSNKMFNDARAEDNRLAYIVLWNSRERGHAICGYPMWFCIVDISCRGCLPDGLCEPTG